MHQRRWCHLAKKLKLYCKLTRENRTNFHVLNSRRQYAARLYSRHVPYDRLIHSDSCGSCSSTQTTLLHPVPRSASPPTLLDLGQTLQPVMNVAAKLTYSSRKDHCCSTSHVCVSRNPLNFVLELRRYRNKTVLDWKETHNGQTTTLTTHQYHSTVIAPHWRL